MRNVHYEIHENGQLNVEISRLCATKQEIEALQSVLVKQLGPHNQPPIVTLDRMDQKSDWYTVKFALRGLTFLKLDTVREWLHSAGLVGWNIDAQSGPKQ